MFSVWRVSSRPGCLSPRGKRPASSFLKEIVSYRSSVMYTALSSPLDSSLEVSLMMVNKSGPLEPPRPSVSSELCPLRECVAPCCMDFHPFSTPLHAGNWTGISWNPTRRISRPCVTACRADQCPSWGAVVSDRWRGPPQFCHILLSQHQTRCHYCYVRWLPGSFCFSSNRQHLPDPYQMVLFTESRKRWAGWRRTHCTTLYRSAAISTNSCR